MMSRDSFGNKIPVRITGLWVRNCGRGPEVLVEHDGRWLLVFQGDIGPGTGEIHEPIGMMRCPPDWLEERE